MVEIVCARLHTNGIVTAGQNLHRPAPEVHFNRLMFMHSRGPMELFRLRISLRARLGWRGTRPRLCSAGQKLCRISANLYSWSGDLDWSDRNLYRPGRNLYGTGGECPQQHGKRKDKPANIRRGVPWRSRIHYGLEPLFQLRTILGESDCKMRCS